MRVRCAALRCARVVLCDHAVTMLCMLRSCCMLCMSWQCRHAGQGASAAVVAAGPAAVPLPNLKLKITLFPMCAFGPQSSLVLRALLLLTLCQCPDHPVCCVCAFGPQSSSSTSS